MGGRHIDTNVIEEVNEEFWGRINKEFDNIDFLAPRKQEKFHVNFNLTCRFESLSHNILAKQKNACILEPNVNVSQFVL